MRVKSELLSVRHNFGDGWKMGGSRLNEPPTGKTDGLSAGNARTVRNSTLTAVWSEFGERNQHT